MKNRIIFIAILVLLINVYLWPKPKDFEREAFIYPEKYSITLMGEVVFPGSYDFFEPTLLNDVIKYAGGFTNEANYNNINLNEMIYKNIIIVIEKANYENDDEDNFIVNINTASFEDLIKVPGITENRAANIILYREQNGLFKSVNDLLNVKYIGEATFEKVKNYLTV